MANVKIEVLRAFYIAGQVVEQGAVVEVAKTDAAAFCAMNKARLIVEDKPAPSRRPKKGEQ